MSRREVREQIFKLLFRAEFYEEAELPEQLELFFEELDQKEEKDPDGQSGSDFNPSGCL